VTVHRVEITGGVLAGDLEEDVESTGVAEGEVGDTAGGG
jgi:hypothetical protein